MEADVIELVWDAERRGTALAPSGAIATVGEHAPFAPEDLLGMSVASCLMRTFLRLAEQADLKVESYAATARLEATGPSGIAQGVTVHAHVVARRHTEREIVELLRASARLSPMAQQLRYVLQLTTEVSGRPRSESTVH